MNKKQRTLIGSRSAELSLTDYTIKDHNWKPEMKMKDCIEYSRFTRKL